MLKHCVPTLVSSLPAPAHRPFIYLTCLGKNSWYFYVQTPDSMFCYFCKKSSTLCLLVGYLYSFPFQFWWFQIPWNCWPAVAELCKEYTKAWATWDPTLLGQAIKHVKTLYNCINSACLDVKHQTEFQTLLAELVHLNCLVVILLLKQISSGIAIVLYTILTVSGWVRFGAYDLSARAFWWPWRWWGWDCQGQLMLYSRQQGIIPQVWTRLRWRWDGGIDSPSFSCNNNKIALPSCSA